MGVVDSGYVSDHTRWMNEQLEKSVLGRQSEGRPRPVVGQLSRIDTTARNNASKVPQKPYPYDVNFFGE